MRTSKIPILLTAAALVALAGVAAFAVAEGGSGDSQPAGSTNSTPWHHAAPHEGNESADNETTDANETTTAHAQDNETSDHESHARANATAREHRNETEGDGAAWRGEREGIDANRTAALDAYHDAVKEILASFHENVSAAQQACKDARAANNTTTDEHCLRDALKPAFETAWLELRAAQSTLRAAMMEERVASASTGGERHHHMHDDEE